jgi:2-dehydro-3-deoxyphosphooctonate aldolase (KDO 8-P synthase)
MKYNNFSNKKPLIFIIGLNVLESKSMAIDVAGYINALVTKYGVPFVFKASFDKANRSSINSYRGVGIEKGAEIFNCIKREIGCEILTDIHEPYQVDLIKNSVDILQLPAFLARQTDLIAALAKSGKIINIKKPQFMSPDQTIHIVRKFKELGCEELLLCERGVLHGYDNLIVDFLGFRIMKESNGNIPIVFDVTHSLQTRSGSQSSSGGRRRQFMDLALAGIVQEISSIFIEVHPNPDLALCDGPSAIKLDNLESILESLIELDAFVKSRNRIDLLKS